MAKKEKNFFEYFQGLPETERVKVRDEFLEKTGVKYPSWYAKMSRRTFLRRDLVVLEMICKQKFVSD